MHTQSKLTRAALALVFLTSVVPVMLADWPTAGRNVPPNSGRHALPGSGRTYPPGSKVVWANEEAPESVTEEAAPAEEEAR